MLFHEAHDLQLQRSDSCSVLCPDLCSPQAHHCTPLGLPCGKEVSNLSLLPPSPRLAAAPLARWGCSAPPDTTAFGRLFPLLCTVVPKAALIPLCLPEEPAGMPRGLEGTSSAADGTLRHALPLGLNEELLCRGRGSPSSAVQPCCAPRRPGPHSTASLQ